MLSAALSLLPYGAYVGAWALVPTLDKVTVGALRGDGQLLMWASLTLVALGAGAWNLGRAAVRGGGAAARARLAGLARAARTPSLWALAATSLLGYAAYFYLMARRPVHSVLVLNPLTLCGALLVSCLALREPVSRSQLAGMALVVAGVAVFHSPALRELLRGRA